jgi:hypothetical protein
VVVGHCEDEDPLALVARADFSRTEYSRRCSVTHSFQLSEDMEQNGRSCGVSPTCSSELGTDDTLDVFEEHEVWLALGDAAQDVGEEVSWVVVPPPLAR